MLGNRPGTRLLQCLVVLLAGCGNQDVVAEGECFGGPDAIERALRQAPAEVRLDGGVKLSDCFKQAANEADVQSIGSDFLTTATRVSARVRRAPHSEAAVELGYLTAVVRNGVKAETGVYYESGRRFEQELAGTPTDTPEFRRGLEAGRRSG